MDRLRSLQYFVAAAEGGSFSAAARQLDVSTTAVAKLVGALERDLGVTLFERRPTGLALSASGAAYLDACRPGLELLDEADEQARSAAGKRVSGTVVVGTQTVIARECLADALPAFNARHPEIQVDLRLVAQVNEPAAGGVDVFLLLGWPSHIGHLVQRTLGATSFVVCAAPSYWARHGMPRHPGELERHNCLTIRGNTGVVLDLWHFQRGDERVSVTARGWLVCDNAHRNTIVDTALQGAGVVRILDWHQRPGHALAEGALVAALTDWQATEVPAINLLYPPAVRRVPRVRAFIDFATQLFADIERQRHRPEPPSASPRWLVGRHSRASSTEARTAAALSPPAVPRASSARRPRGA